MRGAGCTYNDIVDEDIDRKVDRTRSRPLPSGQVGRRQAWVFLVVQALVGLAVLLQFNRFAILLGIASLAVVAVYPFMKRITNWPQLVLGLAFSWGALMGWAAAFGGLDPAALMLYAGSVLWVIGYDTIYAHQDKEDDAIVGVRSTARLFGDDTKSWLVWLYGGALVLFASAYATAEVPVPALAGLLAAAAHMWRQVQRLDIDDPGPVPETVQVERHGRLADFSRAFRRRAVGRAEADRVASLSQRSPCAHRSRKRTRDRRHGVRFAPEAEVQVAHLTTTISSNFHVLSK